jgi:hypothetical protein
VTTRKNVSEDNNIAEEAGFGDGMWTWWRLLDGDRSVIGDRYDELSQRGLGKNL